MLTLEGLTEDELFEVDIYDLEVGAQQSEPPPDNWRDRIRAMFPAHVTKPFSPPHVDLWRWAESVTAVITPRPFVAIWPRGRGKSTHAEMIAADLGARGQRNYCLYVCETQEQADKHVSTIQHMLEADTVAQYFPEVGTPRVGKHGSRAWRRSMMTSANGYTVEAIGLDKAIRGQKIDWTRPDLIVFDDIDAKHDTENAVLKKIGTITTSILPAGADNCAVLFCQNLIHVDSVAHSLSKRPDETGGADYLANRIVSGPHQAVEGLAYEFQPQDDGSLLWVITAGTSLWDGFDLDICQAEINRAGPGAFEIESQHEIDTDDPNALLTTEIINACRRSSHPDLYRIAVGVDPTGGTGQCGIIAVGAGRMGKDSHGFTIADYSTPTGASSATWAKAALRCYHAIKADVIVVERNFGGDMAKETIRNAVLTDSDGDVILSGTNVPILEVTASRGKEVRAQPVSTLFELGKMHHVGHFPELQKQWTKWVPGTKPSPDKLDAEVWAVTELGLAVGGDLVLF